MNSDKSFILFYSNYCQHCKDFLLKLKKLDLELFNTFNKICVDNNDQIPKSIQSVPTIITPTHNYALTDTAVFMWLDSLADQFINKKNTTNVNNTNTTSLNNDTSNDREIRPFVHSEMGGCFSDNFSFLDTEEGPLKHNFSFLGNENISNNIETHQNNNKLNENRLNNIEYNPNIGNKQIQIQNFSRPTMTSNDNNDFEIDLDRYKNNRDTDPNIIQAPTRK